MRAFVWLVQGEEVPVPQPELWVVEVCALSLVAQCANQVGLELRRRVPRALALPLEGELR